MASPARQAERRSAAWTEHERVASANYYRELGRHMNVEDAPASYQELAAHLDAYERPAATHRLVRPEW
jgi:hypothetical protein